MTVSTVQRKPTSRAAGSRSPARPGRSGKPIAISMDSGVSAKAQTRWHNPCSGSVWASWRGRTFSCKAKGGLKTWRMGLGSRASEGCTGRDMYRWNGPPSLPWPRTGAKKTRRAVSVPGNPGKPGSAGPPVRAGPNGSSPTGSSRSSPGTLDPFPVKIRTYGRVEVRIFG